jgi:hypothetical protein
MRCHLPSEENLMAIRTDRSVRVVSSPNHAHDLILGRNRAFSSAFVAKSYTRDSIQLSTSDFSQPEAIFGSLAHLGKAPSRMSS